jgi:hypothetical protein
MFNIFIFGRFLLRAGSLQASPFAPGARAA